MASIDLVCLGVGKGSSYVLRGKPSTSFAIRIDGQPKLLIDCGAGIGLSCQRNLNGIIPSTIYISHNHIDHAGDLPIVLEATKTKPRVLGHATVLQILKERRLHDGERLNKIVTQVADWIEADENDVIHIEENLSLQLVRSIHSYICYGFVLRKDGEDILGYSADSAYNEGVYSQITRSSIAIVDGRDQGNSDHASLQDIDEFARRVSNCSMWVVHYEETKYTFSSCNVKLMREGDVIQVL